MNDCDNEATGEFSYVYIGYMDGKKYKVIMCKKCHDKEKPDVYGR